MKQGPEDSVAGRSVSSPMTRRNSDVEDTNGQQENTLMYNETNNQNNNDNTTNTNNMNTNRTQRNRHRSRQEGTWGDIPDPNIPDDIIRIEGLNVNTMPRYTTQLKCTRMEALRTWARSSGANIIALPENNWNYNKIPMDEHPENFMSSWWDNATITSSWMRHEGKDNVNRAAKQFGGVTLVSNGRIAGTIKGRGWDDMGRWAWHTYHGKRNYRTTCICLYFPCKNTTHEGSVYMQQAAYLDKKYPGEQREPHTEYVADLRSFMEAKIDDGENMLIIGDFNQDIQKWSEPLVELFHDLGLRELISDKHEGIKLPPTFQDGSHAIEGIWGTEALSLESAGLGEFGANFLSPHRTYYGDLKIEKLIGHGMEAIVRPTYRRLRTNIPAIKKKFNKIASIQCRRRNLPSRWKQLRDEVHSQGHITETQIQQFNAMHIEVRRTIACAERNCAKVRRGAVPFCQEGKELMGAISVWDTLIQRHVHTRKKHKPSTQLLRRRIKRYNFQAEWRGMTLAELKKRKKEAEAAYWEFKPHARKKSDDFFSELAFQRSQEDGVAAESHLKQIKNQHANEKTFRRIHMATKKKTRGAASYVEVVNEDGSRTKITEQAPMEAEIMRANEEKLQQANNVDIRMEPLQSHFGEQGDVDKWEAIHRGDLTLPPDYPAERGLSLFFEAISRNHLPAIQLTPTYNPIQEEQDKQWDEYDKLHNEGWKKMKEKTSCGPPTHFGHYRAPIAGSEFSHIQTIIGTLPMIAGFVPELWKECVDTMLVKKISDMQAKKLRLVTLLEPQYLQMSKLVNKLMMDNAEKHGALAPEQYGSRRGKNSRLHCLHKRLLFDMTRIEHGILVLMANDLKSCYDRIVMMIAYLTLRHYGTPKEAALALTICMMVMRHRIRTVFGDSVDWYGGLKWLIKAHGNGQGNGDGPGLWAGISSICLDILREHGYGVEMEATLSHTTLLLAGFSFVDDTDQIQSGSTPEEALQLAQEGLTLWEELIRATGGALEPAKSDWVLINYVWTNGKWTLEPKDDTRRLSVRDPDNNITELTQLAPTEARETLGIWQAPTGCETKQHTELVKAVKTWCSGMTSKNLPSRDVEIAIRSTIGRKIHYCLLPTCFTKAQCKEIIDPVVRRVMPKMVLARTTARTIVHAPTSLFGIGIDDPYVSQLVEHVKTMSDKGGTKGDTGIALANVIEAHVLEVGIAGQITDWDFPKISCFMTNSWIKFTLEHMDYNDIYLKTNHATLKLWRDNDRLLMDDALLLSQGAGGLTHDDLVAIHNCRNFLRVCTISDIVDGYGTRILDEAYECTNPIICTSSLEYKWPKQAPPPGNDIVRWKSFIDSYTSRGRVLRHPVGAWLQNATPLHPWRFNMAINRIYEKTPHGWMIWGVDRTRRRTRIHRYVTQGDVADASEIHEADRIPRIAWKRNNQLQMQGHAPIAPDDNTEVTSLHDLLSDNGWILPSYTIHNSERLKEMIQQGTATGVADGSSKHERSTSGLTIFDGDDDLATGGNYVPGPPKSQISYRAELAGMLGIIVFLNRFCAYHNIVGGTATIGCDNDKALDAAFWRGEEVPCTAASFDIIRMIKQEMNDSPLTFVKMRVKGHQDKNKKYEDLDEWGKANVRADRLAKEFMDRHPDRIQGTDIPGVGWPIYVRGHKIVAYASRDIYFHCTECDIKRYWANKADIDVEGEFDDDTIEASIAWECLSKYSKMIPGYKRRWITKHMAHISATGVVMGPDQRGDRDTNKCPMCDTPEHADHVLRCSSDTASKEYHDKFDEWDQWMKKHTPKDLRMAMTEIHLAYREQREAYEDESWSQEVKEAFRAQLHMSGKALTYGLLHRDWVAIWHKYAITKQLRMTSENWGANVLKYIWDITYTMWRKRCDYLHASEVGRKKILAANIDNDIDTIYNNMPPNTWMTHAQRSILCKRKRVVKSWKSKRKIRWLRMARTMKESHIEYLASIRNSASAQCMHDFLEIPAPAQLHNDDDIPEYQDLDDGDESFEAERPMFRQLNITNWLRANGS